MGRLVTTGLPVTVAAITQRAERLVVLVETTPAEDLRRDHAGLTDLLASSIAALEAAEAQGWAFTLSARLDAALSHLGQRGIVTSS